MDASGGAAAAVWPQLGPRLVPRALREGASLGTSSSGAVCDGVTSGWPSSSCSTDLVRGLAAKGVHFAVCSKV